MISVRVVVGVGAAATTRMTRTRRVGGQVPKAVTISGTAPTMTTRMTTRRRAPSSRRKRKRQRSSQLAVGAAAGRRLVVVP
jgi:hypothetical protein